MSVGDYIIQSKQLYKKTKSHKMEVLDGVLAYRLLNSINLSEQHKQLVRATVSDMKYSIMKERLKKVFKNSGSTAYVKKEHPIKLEVWETLYGKHGADSFEANHSNNQENGAYIY